MDEQHPAPRRHNPIDAERRAAVLRARAEVVDVLSEALWALICAGRGPVSMEGIVPGATSPETPREATQGSQLLETTGV